MAKRKVVDVDVLWTGGKTDKQVSQRWNDLTSAGVRALTGKFKHSGNNTGKTTGLGAWKLKELMAWMKKAKAPKGVMADYRAYYKDIAAAGNYK